MGIQRIYTEDGVSLKSGFKKLVLDFNQDSRQIDNTKVSSTRADGIQAQTWSMAFKHKSKHLNSWISVLLIFEPTKKLPFDILSNNKSVNKSVRDFELVDQSF